MDGFLGQLGALLLFKIPPGTPFVLVMGGFVLVASIVRTVTADQPWMKRWLALTGRVERVTITLLLVSMVALSLFQIVARNLFEKGFVWLDPLLRHAVLWLGFMGAALATAYDRHINIDVLSRFLHGPMARVVHTALRMLAAGVCLALANACYVLLRDEYEFESLSFLDIPTWVLMLIMPVGLLLMCYRFLVSAWRGHSLDPLAAEVAEAAEAAAAARKRDPDGDATTDGPTGGPDPAPSGGTS